MSPEIKADYNQLHLLPYSLEEWVPSDHPARFIREFVRSLDLAGMGFRMRKKEVGRPNYGAELLAGVWLYGYFERIRSSRRLERACREHMSLIWLTGNNAPDHNTLWRFWKDNKKGLRALFRHSVKVALKSDLLGLALHAVDGTKITAASSRSSGWHRKDLEKLLKKVDKSIEEMSLEVESLEKEEEGEYRLPEGLSEKEKLRDAIRGALKELSETDKDHLHPGEKEARMMKNGRVTDFCYNAQIVADGESGLIVAEDVVNDEADHGLLVKMIDEAKENMGQAPARTLADGGYVSGEELSKAEVRGYEVLVNLGEDGGKEKEFHTSNFEFDESSDVVVCPCGGILKYEKTKKSRDKKYPVRIYRCREYKGCGRRLECSKDKRGRTIEIGPYHSAKERQRKKQKESSGKKVLSRRKVIAEPPFAAIKHIDGFRRWMFRGLEGVKTQWSLICLAYNLRKLFKSWLRGEVRLG